MNKLVVYCFIVSVIIGIVGTAFRYDVNLSDALYMIAGAGLYIFGIWASVILLKK